MALEDFLSDLSGGFEGAGMGASLLGGMTNAKMTSASNPWVAGGILGGGALLGIASSMDPAKRRAGRLNARLGRQEAEMNDLSIKSEKTKQAEERRKRAAMQQFGNMFSGYLSAMGKSRPVAGPALAEADLGV
jgi:hypothetical protein